MKSNYYLSSNEENETNKFMPKNKINEATFTMCRYRNIKNYHWYRGSQYILHVSLLGHVKEFLSEQEKAMVDKGKREDTSLPQTLRIVNTISGGLDISGLIVSTTLAHIRRANSIVPEYEASDPEYEHSLTFSSRKVRRLQHPHDDALVIS